MDCIISMFIFKADTKSQTAGNRWAERQIGKQMDRQGGNRQTSNK